LSERKLQVAILCGGRSGEHEISLRSAQAILDHLNPEYYEARRIFIGKDGRWDPAPILPEPGANAGIDVVFPVLHGTFGEDGTVQGLLEMAGLPYVGAGVFASAASMDKEHFKRLCAERNLPVIEYEVIHTGNPHIAHPLEPAIGRFGFPLFVKPANLGSSVGISKAHDRAELEAAVADAARYDAKVLIERAISGQEIECSVIGNYRPQAATPSEILPSHEWYDYDDKYLLDAAKTLIPANLSEEETAEIQRLSVESFKAVECAGMARVDFLVERPSGRIYINEINTIPGFTSISMYPKMWEHAGLPFSQLVEMLIDLALERHQLRQSLRYER
jgi:D-alanine-D-alanine ligase